MDSLTKTFLKNVLLMFLIILIIFYFLGFKYLNQELLIIIAIIYILLLITYGESYKLIIYVRVFILLILTLYILINIKYIPIYSLVIPIVLIIINVILYRKFAESENKLELQELLNERKKDLDRLKAALKVYNIIGLNGEWGTGKSLIIEHLKKDKEDNYNFVEIDLLSLNLDDIKYSIMNELNTILKENGVFSKYSRRLKNLFSNHSFLNTIADYLNIGSSNFKEALNGLKLDLCKLEKPTIIIYEDIDRINNTNIIKSLFGINEKLVENTEKVKVIYQYYDNNLKNISNEIDERYLEKYIQYNVNLTDIELYQLIILKIEENEEYKQIIGKEKINEIFLSNNIRVGNKIYSIEIEYQEFNSIRRIERFLKDSCNSINRLKAQGLKSSEDLIIRTVLIFNIIKYFYPSVYEEFTINNTILEIFTLNIDGKEYNYEYFYNKNRMEHLQSCIESENNQSIVKSRNLFNLFILDKLEYNIHGEYYKDIYKFENAVEILDRHYEESNMNLIRRHNNMAMDRIFWNLLSAGKSELTELEICGQKFIEDVLSYDKSSWKSRYKEYCNDLFYGGCTIFIIGIEESLQLFKSFRIINPEEKYWIRLLEFSKEEFFDVINYEFISAINYVPMDNIKIHKKISELILDLRNEGNLNYEKEFLIFLKMFYKTWYGVSRVFSHLIEYINYMNIEDSKYIQNLKSLLENHIKILKNIESPILEDEIKVNIEVTKKLIGLINLEKSLKKKEYKLKGDFGNLNYNKSIIEELLELKQIDLDKFREKVQEYYYSGKISKSDIINQLKI